MGTILERMDGDLRLRGLSEVTREEYLRRARHFSAFYAVPPDQLTADDVRRYLLHLTDTLRIGPANGKTMSAAIKFLYTVPLDRPEVVARIRLPKVPLKAPRHPEPGRGGRRALGAGVARLPHAAVLRLWGGAAGQRGLPPLRR